MNPVTQINDRPQVSPADVERQIDEVVTEILENIIIHSRTSFSDDEIISFRTELDRAVDFTRRAHEGQYRKSGEPYIFHPLQVAREMSANHMVDLVSIMACLLHDVVEDTRISLEEIHENFGDEVLHVVDGLTKIKNRKIESFDKFFSLALRHPRILYIKIFDRLHNLRTIGSLSLEKQKSIARETVDIFLKICRRLSLMDIADELELLSHRILHPAKVEAYQERIRELQKGMRPNLDEIVHRIGELGRDFNLSVSTIDEYWKPFVDYPSYDRMNAADAFRLRVIMKDKYSAYTMMGVINEQFTHVRSSIYDYISVPRYNNHRSLRFDIMDRGIKIPLSITSEKYHQFNRKGIFTFGFSEDAAKNMLYMRHLEAYLKEEADFRDIEKVFAYHNPEEITVISKDGKPFDMERNSTALDFAFKIHSEVGIRAVSAIVDGRAVPVETRLSDGDQVTIHTVPEAVANASYLEKCSNLRTKRLIANYLNRQARLSAAEYAKRFLEQNLFRYQVDVTEFWTRFSNRYDEGEKTNVLLGILENKKLCDRLILDLRLITRRRLKDILTMEKTFFSRIGSWFTNRPKWQFLRLPYFDSALGHCPSCMPVLKDQCSAVFQDNKIMIHRLGCQHVKNVPEEKLFLVKWKAEDSEKATTAMQIRTSQRYGVGNDITSAFSKMHINIEELVGRSVREATVFDIRVGNATVENLSRLVERLRSIDGVREIRLKKR